MIVLCMEGCHGCGKTALVDCFKRAGVEVLDEAFLDMPSYGLHPQSLLMETTWVCSWFERLLRITNTKKNHENTILITDRSPYSAVFYSDKGELLAPIIRQQVAEVEQFADIHIKTVHVNVDDDSLWTRIQNRLLLEPDRNLLKENQKSWMHKVKSFYTKFEWDFEIDNSEENEKPEEYNRVMYRLISLITSESPAMAKCLEQGVPNVYQKSVFDEEKDNKENIKILYKTAQNLGSKRLMAAQNIF